MSKTEKRKLLDKIEKELLDQLEYAANDLKREGPKGVECSQRAKNWAEAYLAFQKGCGALTT